MHNLLPSQDSATQRLAAINCDVQYDITKSAVCSTKLSSITTLLNKLDACNSCTPTDYQSLMHSAPKHLIESSESQLLLLQNDLVHADDNKENEPGASRDTTTKQSQWEGTEGTQVHYFHQQNGTSTPLGTHQENPEKT